MHIKSGKIIDVTLGFIILDKNLQEYIKSVDLKVWLNVKIS